MAKTYLSIILDETGSMTSVREEVINSYNGLIKKQKKEKGECLVTLTQFDVGSNPDGDVRVKFTNKSIKDVKKITEEDYQPNGCTNLYDAVGSTINKVAKDLKGKKKPRVLFVINTDGFENSSRECSGDDIKKLITEKQGKGWDFLFMGADLTAQQSISIANSMGIPTTNTVAYVKSETAATMDCASATISSYRKGESLKKSMEGKLK